jgi:hypothetical protein
LRGTSWTKLGLGTIPIRFKSLDPRFGALEIAGVNDGKCVLGNVVEGRKIALGQALARRLLRRSRAAH